MWVCGGESDNPHADADERRTLRQRRCCVLVHALPSCSRLRTLCLTLLVLRVHSSGRLMCGIGAAPARWLARPRGAAIHPRHRLRVGRAQLCVHHCSGWRRTEPAGACRSRASHSALSRSLTISLSLLLCRHTRKKGRGVLCAQSRAAQRAAPCTTRLPTPTTCTKTLSTAGLQSRTLHPSASGLAPASQMPRWRLAAHACGVPCGACAEIACTGADDRHRPRSRLLRGLARRSGERAATRHDCLPRSRSQSARGTR